MTWNCALNVYQDMPGYSAVINNHQGYSKSAWTSKSRSRKNGFLPSLELDPLLKPHVPWQGFSVQRDQQRGCQLPSEKLSPAALTIHFSETAFGAPCPWWARFQSSESLWLPAILPPSSCVFLHGFHSFPSKDEQVHIYMSFCYSLHLSPPFK